MIFRFLLLHIQAILAALFGRPKLAWDADLAHPHAADEPTQDQPTPASLTIIDGIAHGDKVVQIPSRRHAALATKMPQILLWHWTATAHGTARAMAARIQKLAGKNERSGSVHFWIEHDGTIYQSVPTNRASWHAGGKTSQRFKVVDGQAYPSNDGKLSVNAVSIGVELVNVGEVRPMKKTAEGWVKAKTSDEGCVYMGWPYGAPDPKTKKQVKGPIVPEAQVKTGIDHRGIARYYHTYTDAQVESATRLTKALMAEYQLTSRNVHWGHVDVDPTRKADPGPLWGPLLKASLG